MKNIQSTIRTFAAIGVALLSFINPISAAHAQSVISLQLVPSVIAGGSGGTATGIVTLAAAAPIGGRVVQLGSSNPELAASIPQITVPAGQTEASFIVATNAQYRRYSGLAFTAAISAANPLAGGTVSATLNVTVQARPTEVVFAPPFSGSGPRCGAGEAGLLFVGETGTLWDCAEGTDAVCRFVQECTLGCEKRPLKGTRRQDVCASAGPVPIVVNPKRIVGGYKGTVSLQLSSGAPAGSIGAVTSNSFFAAPLNPHVDVPFTTGASSLAIGLLTAAVNRIQFAPLRGEVVTPQPLSGGGIFYASRSARAWVAVVPGTPPLVNLKSLALDTTSMPGGGPAFGYTCIDQLFPAPEVGSIALTLSSSHPAVASVLPSPQNQGVYCQTFGVDSVHVGTDTAVTIRAQVGAQSLTAPLLITATPTATQANSFFLDPLSVIGGQSSQATIKLNGRAPVNGFLVTLSSDNPAALILPASVTVPSGADRVSFSIGTKAVGADVLVTLQATPSSSVLLAQLSVLAPAGAPTLTSVTVNPSTVAGGTTSNATVTLSGAALASGAVVNLSSNAGVATVPPSVTVAPGATTAQFVVNTLPVTANTTVTLSAWLDAIGATTVTRLATLTVTPTVQPAPGALAAPSLLSPAHDARFPVGQFVNFDWSDVSGAASYVIQIDDTDTFAAPLMLNQSVTASQYATSALPASRPYWRARAVDAVGNPGAWSAIRQIRVE